MSRFQKLSLVIWHCQYHNVWVPKYRHRVLTGEVGQEVQNCIHVFSGQLSCKVVELNIQNDHIHMISQCSAKGVDIKVNRHIERQNSNKDFQQVSVSKKNPIGVTIFGHQAIVQTPLV